MAGTRASFSEVGPRVLAAIAAGASVADAAQHVGIAERTVKGWLTRGRRKPDSQYGPFAEQVDRIRTEREAVELGTRDDLLAVTWRAAKNGSVPAMRLYSELIDADRDSNAQEDSEDPLAELDELAARRAA